MRITLCSPHPSSKLAHGINESPLHFTFLSRFWGVIKYGYIQRTVHLHMCMLPILLVMRELWTLRIQSCGRFPMLWAHMHFMAIPLASQSSDWTSVGKEISATHSQSSYFSCKLYMFTAVLMLCPFKNILQNGKCKRIRK